MTSKYERPKRTKRPAPKNRPRVLEDGIRGYQEPGIPVRPEMIPDWGRRRELPDPGPDSPLAPPSGRHEPGPPTQIPVDPRMPPSIPPHLLDGLPPLPGSPRVPRPPFDRTDPRPSMPRGPMPQSPSPQLPFPPRQRPGFDRPTPFDPSKPPRSPLDPGFFIDIPFDPSKPPLDPGFYRDIPARRPGDPGFDRSIPLPNRPPNRNELGRVKGMGKLAEDSARRRTSKGKRTPKRKK